MANGRVRRQCGELRRFLGSKRRELKELIEHRAWQFVGEYVALWIPGSSVRRPELDRLRADAHRHQFDAVIVWKFDRFARSVSHLLRALEKFQALGIASNQASICCLSPHIAPLGWSFS